MQRQRTRGDASFLLPIEPAGEEGCLFASAYLYKGVLEEFSILPNGVQAATKQLRAHSEDPTSFRGERLHQRVERLHQNPQELTEFLESANARINRQIQEVVQAMEPLGLSLPDTMRVELQAGFYRFSLFHRDNNHLALALDLELLLDPGISDEVLRFFIAHELLHGAIAKRYPGWSPALAESVALLVGMQILWKRGQITPVLSFLEGLKLPVAFGKEASAYVGTDGHMTRTLRALERFHNQIASSEKIKGVTEDGRKKMREAWQRKGFLAAKEGILQWLVKDPGFREEGPLLEAFFRFLDDLPAEVQTMEPTHFEDFAAGLEIAEEQAVLELLMQVLGPKLYQQFIGTKFPQQAAGMEGYFMQEARSSRPLLLQAEDGLHADTLAYAAHVVHQRQAKKHGPFRTLEIHDLKDPQVRDWLNKVENGSVFVEGIEEASPEDFHFLMDCIDDTQRNVRFILHSKKNLNTRKHRQTIPPKFYSTFPWRYQIKPLRLRSDEERTQLLEMLLQRYAAREGRRPMRFSEAALEMLLADPWSGNIAEMENVIHRAVVYARGTEIQPTDIAMGHERYFYSTRLVDRLANTGLRMLLHAKLQSDTHPVIEKILAGAGISQRRIVWLDARTITDENVLQVLYGKPEEGNPGQLAMARGGALVIENVELLPLRAQRHLLKILRQGGYSKYPEGPVTSLETRWFFTTSADLETAITKDNTLSADFFYKASGFSLEIPALRPGTAQMETTVEQVLGEVAKEQRIKVPTLDPQTRALLAWFPWPGGLDQMHKVFGDILSDWRGETLYPWHLPAEFQLETMINAHYAMRPEEAKKVLTEYHPAVDLEILSSLLSQEKILQEAGQNAATLQKFCRDTKEMLEMSRPRFSLSKHFDAPAYQTQAMSWFTRVFGPDAISELWDRGVLPGLLSYFFTGQGSRKNLEEAVDILLQSDRVLAASLTAYPADSSEGRRRRQAFLRTYRVLFYLNLWGWPTAIPTPQQRAHMLDAEPFWVRELFRQAYPLASKPMKEIIADILQRLFLPPAQIGLQDSIIRALQQAARQSELRQDEQFGTVLEGATADASGPRLIQKYFTLPVQGQSRQLTGPDALSTQIRQWVEQNNLDPHSVRILVNTRTRHKASYKLYAQTQQDISQAVAPSPSDFMRWAAEKAEGLDDRTFVAEALERATGIKLYAHRIPELIAGYVLNEFKYEGYFIHDARKAADLTLRGDGASLPPAGTDAVTWLAQQRNPEALRAEGLIEYVQVKPLGQAQEAAGPDTELFTPAFALPKVPELLHRFLRPEEKMFLNLVLHPQTEETIAQEITLPKTGMVPEKDLPLDKEKQREKVLGKFAQTVESQALKLVDESGGTLDAETVEALIGVIFDSQTTESISFVQDCYPDRKREDPSVLAGEVIPMFKELLQIHQGDLRGLRSTVLLFAKVYQFLLRQDEADLELKFGNRHDAYHVVTMLNDTRRLMREIPMLSPRVFEARYGGGGRLLPSMAGLLHDLGYWPFVLEQRESFRSGKPLPKKSTHSAKSMEIVNAHLKPLLLDVFPGLNAQDPSNPQRTLYDDLTDAILYHSASVKKGVRVGQNEILNPLLFINSLSDKLDMKFDRIKPDYRSTSLFEEIHKYKALTGVGLKAQDLKTRIQKQVQAIRKRDPHGEYVNFLHTFGALAIRDVETGLSWKGRKISPAQHEGLTPLEQKRVRLGIWTILDPNLVDLAEGFGDERNPAYFQVERAKKALGYLRLNRKPLLIKARLVPRKPIAPSIPAQEKILRRALLKELWRVFGKGHLIDPDDFSAFLRVYNKPGQIRNLFLPVQGLLSGFFSRSSGYKMEYPMERAKDQEHVILPGFVNQDPSALYPFVLGLAKGIPIERLAREMGMHLGDLAPDHVPMEQRRAYVVAHPPDTQTWILWSKKFIEGLLAESQQLRQVLHDPIRWRTDEQWEGRLAIVDNYLLPHIQRRARRGPVRIGVSRPGFPPNGMLATAKLMHLVDVDAVVTGIGLASPNHVLVLANGDRVLLDDQGKITAFDLRNTSSDALYESYAKHLKKFFGELRSKIAAKIEKIPLRTFLWAQTTVADLQRTLKDLYEGTLSKEEATLRMESLYLQSLFLLGEFQKLEVIRPEELSFQVQEAIHPQRRMETITPRLRQQAKDLVASLKESRMNSQVSPEGLKIFRLEKRADRFYEEWRSSLTLPELQQAISFMERLSEDEKLDYEICFNQPLPDLRKAAGDLKDGGMLLRGYGMRERRNRRGDNVAFVRWQKSDGTLMPAELCFTLYRGKDGSPRLPLDHLRLLLPEIKGVELLEKLAYVVPSDMRVTDANEHREALWATYFNLIRTGIYPHLDLELTMFKLSRPKGQVSWQGVPDMDVVHSVLGIAQEIVQYGGNPQLAREAVLTLGYLYEQATNPLVQAAILDAINKIYWTAHMPHLLPAHTWLRNVIARWVGTHLKAAQVERVLDDRLRRKAWVAQKLSQAKDVEPDLHRLRFPSQFMDLETHLEGLLWVLSQLERMSPAAVALAMDLVAECLEQLPADSLEWKSEDMGVLGMALEELAFGTADDYVRYLAMSLLFKLPAVRQDALQLMKLERVLENSLAKAKDADTQVLLASMLSEMYHARGQGGKAQDLWTKSLETTDCIVSAYAASLCMQNISRLLDQALPPWPQDLAASSYQHLMDLGFAVWKSGGSGPLVKQFKGLVAKVLHNRTRQRKFYFDFVQGYVIRTLEGKNPHLPTAVSKYQFEVALPMDDPDLVHRVLHDLHLRGVVAINEKTSEYVLVQEPKPSGTPAHGFVFLGGFSWVGVGLLGAVILGALYKDKIQGRAPPWLAPYIEPYVDALPDWSGWRKQHIDPLITFVSSSVIKLVQRFSEAAIRLRLAVKLSSAREALSELSENALQSLLVPGASLPPELLELEEGIDPAALGHWKQRLSELVLAEDASRAAQRPGPRGNLSPARLTQIMSDENFQLLHETYPARPAEEQADPFKKELDDQAGEAIREAQTLLAHPDILEFSGIRGPPDLDLSNKRLKFVHHEDLVTVPTHTEAWVDPIDKDTMYITHEIWRSLNKEQRAILLLHEIVESELLKGGKELPKAHATAVDVEKLADPNGWLDRRVVEILKDYRIYNGVDQIELFVTHPHGDHANYVEPYVKGEMENLIGCQVPPLKEKLELKLGNKFTHEVTSYMLRASKRVISIFDMGGYKGEGPDPWIETINAHYRIDGRKLMKPVTIYADMYTAKTLDFQGRIEKLRKKGFKVRLEIFDPNRRTIVIVDRDKRITRITAHPAYHLPRYIGSSAYTLERLGEDKKTVVSSFSLVSEVGDTLPQRLDDLALEKIACSDIIAIDGTNFASAPNESPIPLRFQKDKIPEFTERLNRGWATVSHFNTTTVGSVAEALEASRTLDPNIPIVVFAGKDSIDQLARSYEVSDKDGSPLLRTVGDKSTGQLRYLESNHKDLQPDSRGAKIYLVSDVSKFLSAYRALISKDIALKDVLNERLRAHYASGRNMKDVEEYLRDWVKNPGLNWQDFMWLFEELRKGPWEIAQTPDVVNSFVYRTQQTITDFFSPPRGDKFFEEHQQLSHWMRDHLSRALEDFVQARRPLWEGMAPAQAVAVMAKELQEFLAREIAGLPKVDETRGVMIDLSKGIGAIESLNVQTDRVWDPATTPPQKNRVIFQESLDDMMMQLENLLVVQNVPADLHASIRRKLRDHLLAKSNEWRQVQAQRLPRMLLEEAQHFTRLQAGKLEWRQQHSDRLVERLRNDLTAHRNAGVALSPDALQAVLYEMLGEGALPTNDPARKKIYGFLRSQDKTKPDVLRALIALCSRDYPALNLAIKRELLMKPDGTIERFEAKLERLLKEKILSKDDIPGLLEAWTSHAWGSTMHEVDWLTLLLRKYQDLKGDKTWLRLGRKELQEQIILAMEKLRIDQWSRDQIQAMTHGLFEVKHPQGWMRLIYHFIVHIQDPKSRAWLISLLREDEKQNYRQFESRYRRRKVNERDLKSIESVLWEFSKTGAGKVLTVGTGHFGATTHKAVHLLNQLFYKPYAEIFLKGRPRLEGSQGRIGRDLYARKNMRLLGKTFPVRARLEDQWPSGHITFDESIPVLELIYNKRIALGLDPGQPLPSRGISQLSKRDLDGMQPLNTRIIFTTSSKYVTPATAKEEAKIAERMSPHKRRLIARLPFLFKEVELGAGRKTIDVKTLQSRAYSRGMEEERRETDDLRRLFDAATEGRLPRDLADLPNSKKPDSLHVYIEKIRWYWKNQKAWRHAPKKGASLDAFEKFESLTLHLRGQFLRLGMRVVMDYGSEHVIQDEEIGARDRPSTRKALEKPLEERGLHFQFADAFVRTAQDTVGDEVAAYFRQDTQDLLEDPPLLFGKEGGLTDHLENLKDRYGDMAVVKAAVLADPLKQWAENHGIQLRFELPADPEAKADLTRYLKETSLESFNKEAKDRVADLQLRRLDQNKNFTEPLDLFDIRREGDILTLDLNKRREKVLPADRRIRHSHLSETFINKAKAGWRKEKFEPLLVELLEVLLGRLDYLARADLDQKILLGHERTPAIMQKFARLAGLPEASTRQFYESTMYHDTMHLLLNELGVNREDLTSTFLRLFEEEHGDLMDTLQFFAAEYRYVPYKVEHGKRVVNPEDFSRLRKTRKINSVIEEIILDALVFPYRPQSLHAQKRLRKLRPLARAILKSIRITHKAGNLWELFAVKPAKGKTTLENLQAKVRELTDLLRSLGVRGEMQPERVEEIHLIEKMLDGLIAMSKFDSRFTVSSDGTPVHYRIGGNPKAEKTLFLMHGYTGSTYHWIMQLPAFAKDYRIVIMDMRGHGKTPFPRIPESLLDDLRSEHISMDDVIQQMSQDLLTEQTPRDMAAVLENLEIGDGVTLMGHSMGGMAILEFARKILTNPQEIAWQSGNRIRKFGGYRKVIEKLILIDSTPIAPEETSPYGRYLKKLMGIFIAHLDTLIRYASGLERYIFGLKSRPHEVSNFERVVNRIVLTGRNDVVFDYMIPVALEPCRGLEGTPDEGKPHPKMSAAWEAMAQHDTTEILTDVPWPTMVMYGAEDRFVDFGLAKPFFDLIPSHLLHTVEIPKQRHLPHVEDPDVANHEIRKFLTQPVKRPIRADRRMLLGVLPIPIAAWFEPLGALGAAMLITGAIIYQRCIKPMLRAPEKPRVVDRIRLKEVGEIPIPLMERSL